MAKAERKPVISLSWEPKRTLLSSVTKKSPSLPDSVAVYIPNAELVDGLFVPPNNHKNLNKLLRKQLKETAGKDWFDMPALTITPELKKDIQLLKVRSLVFLLLLSVNFELNCGLQILHINNPDSTWFERLKNETVLLGLISGS
ncbi:Fcf2 pre-rRNA processing protein [Actinidia rufa]|uniref:Fcf2 pre-rRNA processing protein n=1 Tax=Actinidia rufa TaxID=165716 RepID=A0A7J0GL52_9ERIC|nr:Fcf2 pre-rRNA processing protein [Actinidia rufa]